jgi:hypothetical protein
MGAVRLGTVPIGDFPTKPGPESRTALLAVLRSGDLAFSARVDFMNFIFRLALQFATRPVKCK